MLLTLHAAFPWTWVWLFVACFCLFFNTGPTNTILANVSHPSMRAAAFALNILVIHALGDVLSPVVIGILGDRKGMDFAFSVVGGAFILAAIFWFAGMRFLARDTERAPLRLAAVPRETKVAELPRAG
jgi:predicted MFS family arabinose efflux permease